jgi:hypothetical protein
MSPSRKLHDLQIFKTLSPSDRTDPYPLVEGGGGGGIFADAPLEEKYEKGIRTKKTAEKRQR